MQDNDQLTFRSLIMHAIGDWKHTLWRVIDTALIPLSLFYIAFAIGGVWPGMGAATAWSCLRLFQRYKSGTPSGTLYLAATVQLVRLLVAVILMSPRAWAVQGVAQTAAGGAVLMASGFRGPSLLVSNATGDATPWVARLLGASHAAFSRTMAVVWGFEQLIVAATNLVIAQRFSVGTYMVLRPLLGWAWAIPALLFSVRTLRKNVYTALPAPLPPAQ